MSQVTRWSIPVSDGISRQCGMMILEMTGNALRDRVYLIYDLAGRLNL